VLAGSPADATTRAATAGMVRIVSRVMEHLRAAAQPVTGAAT